MRIQILLIFHLLLSSIAFSQVPRGLESASLLDSIPSVDGVLENYQKDFNKDLFINYTVITPGFKGVLQKTADIKEDGSFTIQLDEAYPYQKINLSVGDLYKGVLIANANLFVRIDLNEMRKKPDHFASKSVEFEGEDGPLTEYYNAFLEFKTEKKAEIKREKFSALMNRTSQNEFKVRQLDSYFEELEKLESQFAKKYGKTYQWILENERLTEYYGDLASIFIGKPIPKNLWNNCLDHEPTLISEMSNRYYGILATKLWSHEEKEIRAFSRMIFKADVEDEEEKKRIDAFMVEQDKKKAGVSYDNEVYSKGVEAYISKYEDQLANAKLDLYVEKLSELPNEKLGLVAIKGQPLDFTDRTSYIAKITPLIGIDWQASLIQSEFENDQELISSISELVSNSPFDGSDVKLGKEIKRLSTGGTLWKSNVPDINALLRSVKDFYKEKAIIIYIWDPNCTSCTDELRLAGLTYDKIEDEPLEILTISLNRNTSDEDWSTILEKSFVKGHHLLLDKKLTSEIIAYFQLPPVPCYLYFDREGNYNPYYINSISQLDIKEIVGASDTVKN